MRIYAAPAVKGLLLSVLTDTEHFLSMRNWAIFCCASGNTLVIMGIQCSWCHYLISCTLIYFFIMLSAHDASYTAIRRHCLWSCIRVKTVRKLFESNSRCDLMTYVLIDAFVILALLLISS